MIKISPFLLAISCAIAVISSTSCNKDDAIPAPSTTFDKTQIEAKTYNLGDSVKADIEIAPNRPLKEIKVKYNKLGPGNVYSWVIFAFQVAMYNIVFQF